MVADLAIVGDMRTNHKKAAVADPGDHTAAFGSRVNCHIFADRVVAPNDELRSFTAVLEVLRLEPDRGEWKQPRTLTDRRPAVDHDVGAARDPRAERDILADDAIGADYDGFGEHRPRRNNGRRVNLRHRDGSSNRPGSWRRTRTRPLHPRRLS